MQLRAKIILTLVFLGAVGFFVRSLCGLSEFPSHERSPFAFGYGMALVSLLLIALLFWESRKPNPPDSGGAAD